MGGRALALTAPVAYHTGGFGNHQRRIPPPRPTSLHPLPCISWPTFTHPIPQAPTRSGAPLPLLLCSSYPVLTRLLRRHSSPLRSMVSFRSALQIARPAQARTYWPALALCLASFVHHVSHHVDLRVHPSRVSNHIAHLHLRTGICSDSLLFAAKATPIPPASVATTFFLSDPCLAKSWAHL